MVKAINLKAAGSIENFEIINIDLPDPVGNEVTVDHEYIAINHSEILLRKNNYKTNYPVILGNEAIGKITKVSPDIKFPDVKVGMRVIYATVPHGSYCEARNIDFKYCVVVPEDIDIKTLIGCFSKAMTAQYLTKRVVRMRETQNILVHGAAGGVGSMLTQLINHYGIKVFGTVVGDMQKDFALQNGCTGVIDTSKEDFVPKMFELTNNCGADVVYDLVGGDYVSKSIDCINYLGIIVSCGDTAGKAPVIDLSKLDAKCGYLTRTRLEVYRFYRLELLLACEDVFELIRTEVFKPTINEFSFKDIPLIHKEMESFSKIGTYIAKM